MKDCKYNNQTGHKDKKLYNFVTKTSFVLCFILCDEFNYVEEATARSSQAKFLLFQSVVSKTKPSFILVKMRAM